MQLTSNANDFINAKYHAREKPNLVTACNLVIMAAATTDSEAQTGNLLWQIIARFIQLLFLEIKRQLIHYIYMLHVCVRGGSRIFLRRGCTTN